MALESASYITGLNSSNPSSTDTVSQADDHLRLIKNVLKNTFPNLDQPVTATPAQLNSPVPQGFIGLWSGSIGTIPGGWALCDGTNGTPNLRDRFVMGAGGTYVPGNTGGSTTTTASGSHTHTMLSAGAHTHTGNTGSTILTINQIPSHTHTIAAISNRNTAEGGSEKVADSDNSTTMTTNATGGGQGHTHTISSDGTHAHTINDVADHTHTVIPPYYALAYIMKT